MKITPPTGGTQATNGSATGTVGGDLSGTLPGPTVVGIGGIPIGDSPADNEILVYDAGTTTIYWEAGATLPWFDVTAAPYNAVGDGITNDTTGIQAALDAAVTAGGGIVYFPLGDYLISGALQDTGRSNAQLLLPRIQAYSAAEQITIILVGQAAPPAVPSVVGSMILPNNGPVLRSNLGAGTGNLIGAWGPAGSFGDFSNVRVIIHNLSFRMVANPTNSGVDLSHVAACELKNVNIDTSNYDVASIASQSTSTSYGLKLPGVNNGASTIVETVNVVGFYNGILTGEHAVMDNVAVWGSRKAYEVPAGYHAQHWTRVGTYHCGRGIVGTGLSYLQVDQFNIEHAASGTWVPVYDIDDASNFIKGNLRWHVVLAGTGVDSTFTVNGVTGIAYTQLDVNTTTSFATPAIVLGTAAAAGAASTVIRSDSTIAAFDATVPTTQAFGDAAATGSVAFAARRDHKHGMPSATQFVGPILISDTHSTPLVFADLLQNEAGDDLLYADV